MDRQRTGTRCLLLTVFLASACSRPLTVVEVRLSSAENLQVDALAVTTRYNGQSTQTTLRYSQRTSIPPTRRFTIGLPERIQGEIELEVTGLVQDQPLAQGQSRTTLTPEAVARVEIALTRLVNRIAFTTPPVDSLPEQPLRPVTVALVDALDNPVLTDETIALTIASGPSGAELAGTTSVAASGGVAQFPDLVLAREGTYTLQAAAGTLPPATSPSFTVSNRVGFARGTGGSGVDEALGVAPLPDGSTLVTGYFEGTATFGLFTLVASGAFDAFVACYGPDGRVAWAHRISGPGDDFGSGIIALADGGALVAGYFQDSASFDNDPQTLQSAGSYDAFIARYSAQGDLVWVRQAGGSGDDFALGIAALPGGDAVLTGYFDSAADFGTSSLTAAGIVDIFVARVTDAGDFVWARQAGGSGVDLGRAIATLPDGSTVIAGDFENSASFDGVTIDSPTGFDSFIARYDASGQLTWVRNAVGGTEGALGIAGLGDGSTVVTGYFTDTVTFSGQPLTAAGDSDLFLVNYDPAGTLVWAQRAGGPGSDVGAGLAAQTSGEVLVTGYFSGTATFDTTTVRSAGRGDLFVANYRSDGTVAWVRRNGGIEQDQGNAIATFRDGSLFVAGSFRETVDFGETPDFGPVTLRSSGENDVLVVHYLPLPTPAP